ncbi:MAG: allantoicase [Myxococcaceae bacterium]
MTAGFKKWVELSADALGAFVVLASDDYFAPKENLLKPSAPVFLPHEYTDKGKWMDGWESQRRREPGSDFAVIRLGAPGRVRGVVVDTTHFKGNAPQRISLEGIDARYDATPAELRDSKGWFELVPLSEVKPDFPNPFELKASSARVTHVRLNIHPDGGVARLRVYGEVEAVDRTFWSSGSVDLGAVENGGTVAAVSDEFFGPPSNMLLPGRGVNMGDGWETKRRRTPGSDWTVVKLARRGVIERVELDTHFFKGNAPQATLLEAIDAPGMNADELESRLRSPTGWSVLVDRTALVQHRRHQLEPSRPMVATHVRVHIFPHGGVNRLRLFGHAVDSPSEARAREVLHALGEVEAGSLFRSFCGSSSWVTGMLARRPFSSVRAMFLAADELWWSLSKQDWLEAFAAHPRIGEKTDAKWSKGEQRAVDGADVKLLERLVTLNAQYFEKFGFIYIVCATGKSAGEMLSILEERIERSSAEELEAAAREQAKITRLRIEKWLREQR